MSYQHDLALVSDGVYDILYEGDVIGFLREIEDPDAYKFTFMFNNKWCRHFGSAYTLHGARKLIDSEIELVKSLREEFWNY